MYERTKVIRGSISTSKMWKLSLEEISPEQFKK